MAANPAQPAERGAAGIRGILGRQIGGALDALRDPRKLGDVAVHSARKDLKRARAGLRLLRVAAGAKVSKRENIVLRDAARPLSLVRDAKVMLDTTARLIEHERNAAARTALARLRRVLRDEQRRVRAGLSPGGPRLKQVVRSLEAARSRAVRLRVKNDHPSALWAGVQRIYREGRQAMQKAAAVRSDEELHEARKQVKYLGAAMKYLHEIGAADLNRLILRADSLASDLGDDHDLAVLQTKIATMPAESGSIDRALALHLQRRRAALQKKALAQARRLYEKKPAAFVASL